MAELEPDIKLVRADWDCYYDGAPEGMDETLVVNSENSDNRPQYAIEVVADTKGEANLSASATRKTSIAYTWMRQRSLPGSKASGMKNVWN